MTAHHASLWDRLDPALVTLSVTPTAAAADEKARGSNRVKAGWAALRGLGVLLWSYALLKVFIGDVDQELVDGTTPHLQWLVDDRGLIFLGVGVVLVIATRKFFPLVVAYLLLFPLIVLCWHLPRALYKKGSWNLAIGAVHVLSAWVMGLRFTVLMVFLLVLSGTLAAAHVDAVLIIAIVVALATLALGTSRTFMRTVTANRFIAMQQTVVTKAIGTTFVSDNFKVEDITPRGEIELMTKAQADTFLQRVSTGVLVHRGAYFWAYRMEEYRKSPAALIASALSVVWLLTLGTYTFAVANYALFKIDATEFATDGKPGFLRFLYYSLSALYVNEISGLTPEGSLSTSLKILAAMFGAVFVVTLLITFILSFRQSRDDDVARESVDEIRRRAAELDARMVAVFDVSVEEAVRRLEEFRHGLIGILAFFGRHVPPEFGTEGAERRPR